MTMLVDVAPNLVVSVFVKNVYHRDQLLQESSGVGIKCLENAHGMLAPTRTSALCTTVGFEIELLQIKCLRNKGTYKKIQVRKRTRAIEINYGLDHKDQIPM